MQTYIPTTQNSLNGSQMMCDHEKEKPIHSYSQGMLQDHFYTHKYLLPREAEIYILQDITLLSSTCNHLISVVDLIAAWSIGYNELSHFSGSTEWREKAVREMIYSPQLHELGMVDKRQIHYFHLQKVAILYLHDLYCR